MIKMKSRREFDALLVRIFQYLELKLELAGNSLILVNLIIERMFDYDFFGTVFLKKKWTVRNLSFNY